MSAPTLASVERILAIYERLNLTAFSTQVSAIPLENGKFDKEVKTGSWKHLTQSRVNYNQTYNGVAIRTGKDFNCTVIDIDDLTAPHNIDLMDLMSDCNMVAETFKGGRHYMFKYDPRLKQTTGNKLDIRNDGGIIYAEPSHAVYSGKVVGKYEWVLVPDDDETLLPVPETVIQYLREFDAEKYIVGENKPKEKKVVNTIVSEEEEDNLEDTQNTDEQTKTKKIIEVLLEKIAKTRWDNYDDWLKIGIICYNEKLPLELWDRLSKQSAKYKAGVCSKKWTTFQTSRTNKLSQATLWKWLKQDDPTTFYSLMEERQDFWNLINELNHNDIAEYFYNIHPDAYIHSEQLGWYTLQNNNVWRQTEKNIPPLLKRNIADTLQDLAKDTKLCEIERHSRVSKTLKPDDPKQKDENELHKKNMKIIATAYKTFGSSEFCNGVISFTASYYDDPELEKKIDCNSYVFAFNNGLFDLKTCEFRPISPADYISTTCGYDYSETSNKQTRKLLDNFLFGLFENTETKNYLLKVLASCLFGGNRFEEFYCFTGTGGNGKGVIDTLLRNAFGDYYLSVDNSLFTKPLERKDQPIPALVEARNRRIMMTTEPESDDKLQVGLLKKMSGNDIIEARTLHSKHIFKYVAPYKVIIQTNHIPKLSKVEQAVQRRMRIIQFPFQFKPEGQVSLPHHRIGDPDVKEVYAKSPEWRNEFVLMLTEIYTEIKNLSSLPQPASITETTQGYFNEQNSLKDWLEQHYVITTNENDIIKSAVLKSQYETDTGMKISDKTFAELLQFNNVQKKRKADGMNYTFIKRIPIQETTEIKIQNNI